MKYLGAAALLTVVALAIACGDDDSTPTGSSTSSTGGTSSGSTGTGGTSSGGTSGTSTAALTGSCATLKDCCPKVTDTSSQSGCNFALANCGNNQGVCTDTLKNYQTKGCP